MTTESIAVGVVCLLVGTILGIAFMSMLQINREGDEE